jgi:ATP-binding cassette subfamily A (ABC1) protein 3
MPFNHLRALLRKNYIIWKRNKLFSFIEIGIPVGIACFLFLIRSLVDVKNFGVKSYVDQKIRLYPDFPP